MRILDFISSENELYNSKMKPIAEHCGLTAMELSIILFLANNPEYDTATEIVTIRHLTKSHVSASVRSLEEKGLLKKEYRNGDHRTVHLVLLPASEEIISAGRTAQDEFYSILTDNFSEYDLWQLNEFIGRMYENVLNELQKGIKNEKR